MQIHPLGALIHFKGVNMCLCNPKQGKKKIE